MSDTVVSIPFPSLFHFSQPQKRRRLSSEENADGNVTQVTQGEEARLDVEMSADSQECKWEEVEYHRKVVPLLRSRPVGNITVEKIHQAFMNNARVSKEATTDDYIRLCLADVKNFIDPLLNKSLKQLDMSDLVQKKNADSLFKEFQNVYVPMMDESIKAFLHVTFRTLDDAKSAFNLVIRSYVSGFSVHRSKLYTLRDGTRKQILQCHTRNHHAATTPTCEPWNTKQNCSWSAIVKFVGGGVMFETIHSFSLHSLDCFCHDSRMTPAEASFRNDIPSNHLNAVLQKFGQDRAAKDAIYKRRSRNLC